MSACWGKKIRKLIRGKTERQGSARGHDGSVRRSFKTSMLEASSFFRTCRGMPQSDS